MATKNEEGAERSDVKTKDLGDPNPGFPNDLVDRVVPEKDEGQGRYKRQLKAKSHGEEAKAKAEQVASETNPDAKETPSGAALLATAGVGNDTDRGEAYARVKSAIRHGVVEPGEADRLVD